MGIELYGRINLGPVFEYIIKVTTLCPDSIDVASFKTMDSERFNI